MLIEEYHGDDAVITTPLLISDTMGSPVAKKLQAKLMKFFQQSPIGARLFTRLRITKPHGRGAVVHCHGLCITKKATATVKVHIIDPDVAEGRWGEMVFNKNVHHNDLFRFLAPTVIQVVTHLHFSRGTYDTFCSIGSCFALTVYATRYRSRHNTRRSPGSIDLSHLLACIRDTCRTSPRSQTLVGFLAEQPSVSQSTATRIANWCRAVSQFARSAARWRFSIASVDGIKGTKQCVNWTLRVHSSLEDGVCCRIATTLIRKDTLDR